MKRLFLLLAAIVTFAVGAVAQSATEAVEGTVRDAHDGQPVIGATIKVDGTSAGAVTDVEGKFALKVPSSAKTITVSSLGYTTLQVRITPKMVISLEPSAQTFKEVVVTGYGVTRKAAFTGAASVVDGSVIEKKNDVNFVKALEGNVTGIQYNNSTSMPGQYGSVYVRGMGSLSSSSQPLYVIDGMPVHSDYDGMYDDTNNYFDPMAAYNPNDIESVTVLKDAAATAIYGSRAANGVIIITTKKGGGSKFQINLDVKQGFTKMANSHNMKFANAQQTMNAFASGYAARTGRTFEDAYQIMLGQFPDWDGVSSTDWIDAVTRTAYYQDYNLSFQGTTGQTNYYASLGYIDTDGIVINSGNQRYSGRVNLDTKYQWITVGLNAQYSYTTNNSFSQATSGSMTSAIVGAMSTMTPMDPVYDADGNYYGAGALYNPVAVNDAKLGDLSKVTNQTINANPWLRVDLPFGIYAKTNFGVNIMDQRQYDYWSGVYNPQGVDYNGLGQQYNSRASTLTWTNTIGWDKTFNDVHSVDVLLGQEMQRYEYWQEFYGGYDFPFCDDGMRDLATAGASLDMSYYKAQTRLASYFADAHYSYANRYYASASVRRDGSSVFGVHNRWGNFWSVGAKWRITEEDFLKGNRIITNAALRASYGTVGNQSLPDIYVARGYYAAGYNYNQTTGMVPSSIANPDLTWEKSNKLDIGFDLSLFNRLSLTFDYYNDRTTDALYKVPISMVTGINSVYKNIGKIENRGIELGINGTPYVSNDIAVNAFFNLTWNKNKVLKLADGSIEGSYQIIEEGRPYRQFKMPEWAGVDKETGKPLWYLNATGDETTSNYTEAAKRYVGSAEPKVIGAFGASANAYGFDLSLQFNFRLGGKVYDSGHKFTGRGMSLMTPLVDLIENSWTPENTDAKYPQYIYGDPYNATANSSLYLMPGDFLRLSNITFGYSLPQSVLSKIKLSKVRFYTTFDNVHTWTKADFIGFNPETYSSGVIAWQYPGVFTFTGGVQLSF